MKRNARWWQGDNRGAIALMALAFAVSAVWVWRTARSGEAGGVPVLRWAHFEQDRRAQEALDAISRDFERLHPGIRVEQITVPRRHYQAWINTQLIGGRPPDIVHLQSPFVRDEAKARYIRPISVELAAPNPHNAGTPLAGVPWRNTLVDGAATFHISSDHLLETYGVPMTMETMRLFVNLDLLRAVAGHERLPRTVDDLFELAELCRTYRETGGRTVFPLVGSRHHAPLLFNQWFGALTQRLDRRLDVLGTGGVHDARDHVAHYLHGRWSMDEPDVRAALALVRRAAGLFQPGFELQERGDALFYFSQGRALMVTATSQEVRTLADVRFRLGIARLPFPDPHDPQFAPFVIGRPSESQDGLMGLGIPLAARNPDLALDFLRYLTSQPVQRRFARESGWLPSTIGAEPAPGMEPFMPVLDGALPRNGVMLTMGDLARVNHVYHRNLHRLIHPLGSVDDFVRAYAAEIRPVFAADLQLKGVDNRREDSWIQDTILAAYARRAALGAEGEEPRLAQAMHLQNNREVGLFFWMDQLATAPP